MRNPVPWLTYRTAINVLFVVLYIPMFTSMIAEVVRIRKVQRGGHLFSSRDWGYRQLLISQVVLAIGIVVANVALYIHQWDFPYAHASHLPVPKIARRPLVLLGFLFAILGGIALVVLGMTRESWRSRIVLRGCLLRILTGGWTMMSLCAFQQETSYVQATVSIFALWLQEETRGSIYAADCIEAYIGALHFWAGVGKLNADFLRKPPSIVTLLIEPFIFSEMLRPAAYWMCPLVEMFPCIVMCTRWRWLACSVLFMYHTVIVVTLLYLGKDPVAFFWQVSFLVPMFRGTIDKYHGMVHVQVKVEDERSPAALTTSDKHRSWCHIRTCLPWIVMLGTLTWGGFSPRSLEVYPESTKTGAAMVAVSHEMHPIVPEDLSPTLRNMIDEKGCLSMSSWIVGHDPFGPVKGASLVSESLDPSIEIYLLLFTNSLPVHRRVLAMLGVGTESDFSAATRLVRCRGGDCHHQWTCNRREPPCHRAYAKFKNSSTIQDMLDRAKQRNLTIMDLIQQRTEPAASLVKDPANCECWAGAHRVYLGDIAVASLFNCSAFVN